MSRDADPPAPRRIIHVDMDAFFAAVEQRDDPALAGRPVAVGGVGRRGVVAAASYEARRFGVHSAMPAATAARRCPELVFVRPRFEVYRSIAEHLRTLFAEYTPLIEPLSLDEAFLDVTTPLKGPPSGTRIAQAIRLRIWQELRLTASAGVSFNKFIAKVASDVDKPNGLTVIAPPDAATFLARLPVEHFYGVGPATARKLHAHGFRSGQDLRQTTPEHLAALMGRRGRYLYRMAMGQDDRPVVSFRQRKSVGAEKTFFDNLTTPATLHAALASLASRLEKRLARHQLAGRALVLKLRYANFDTHTRQLSRSTPLHTASDVLPLALHLLNHPAPSGPVRLLGLTVKALLPRSKTPPRQLVLPLTT